MSKKSRIDLAQFYFQSIKMEAAFTPSSILPGFRRSKCKLQTFNFPQSKHNSYLLSSLKLTCQTVLPCQVLSSPFGICCIYILCTTECLEGLKTAFGIYLLPYSIETSGRKKWWSLTFKQQIHLYILKFILLYITS